MTLYHYWRSKCPISRQDLFFSGMRRIAVKKKRRLGRSHTRTRTLERIAVSYSKCGNNWTLGNKGRGIEWFGESKAKCTFYKFSPTLTNGFCNVLPRQCRNSAQIDPNFNSQTNAISCQIIEFPNYIWWVLRLQSSKQNLFNFIQWRAEMLILASNIN